MLGMTRKVLCDKCGKELNYDYSSDINEIWINDVREASSPDYEFCEWCFHVLRIYMATKPTKKEKEIIEKERDRLAEIAQESAYND
jgi:hypothetical protein